MKDPAKITHTSAKDERDYLLEYNSIDLSNLDKVNILGVPVDNVTIDECVALILHLIENKSGYHHVLFLDPLKLVRMRKGKKLHTVVEHSTIILAEGAGIPWAARKLKHELKERIAPIGLMMDLVRLSEMKGYSIFLLGSREEVIEKVFFNLTRHFPKLRIVGRHSGHWNQQREMMVKEAMRKTSPDIIFLAMDFPEQEVWIEKNTNYFGKAIVIGVGGTFDLLSGREKKAPDSFQLNGLTWFWRILMKPWRIDKIFRMLQFFVLAFISRILNKRVP